jgi:sialate O-acetylesterase
MKTRRIYLFVISFLLTFGLTWAGELRFSRHYNHDMVLQREKPVLIKGFAENDAEVTVSFLGQTQKTKADANGEWSVTLKPIPAKSKGAELVAESKGKKAKIENVVVGDVFLFARQTTIDVSLGKNEAGKKAATALPAVRLLSIDTIPSIYPQQDLEEGSVRSWVKLDKEAAKKLNAAAFYLAQGISKNSETPIGIIDLNMGHHFPIAWLDKAALLETQKIFGEKAKQVEEVMESMESALTRFKDEEGRKEREAKRPNPEPHPVEDPRYPAAGYNAVLHPLRGLALKGILLQLGNNYPYRLYEDLVREGKITDRAHLGQVYKDAYDIRKVCLYLEPETIPRIPREWRRIFGDENLPIGWITPPGSDLVTLGRHHFEMRELQRQTAKKEQGVDLIMPGTEHVPFSAQPADEALLGKRCRQWILGAVYRKEDIIATGPVFDHMTLDYSTARIFFKPGTAKGLSAKPGALDHFEVAGGDLVYSPATAKIDGETILLKSDAVNRIVHVRYNWNTKPDQGLTNASGLPAFPFNTDGHEYPEVIKTLGEEVLPEEFFTSISEWKNEAAVIVNGRLQRDYKSGKPLGPTGLRVSFFGPNLYVNSAFLGSPADGKILPGDYLYAVNGALFDESIYKQVAEAITHAETEEGKGIIRFDLLRSGEKMTVELQLEVLGSFSSTSPYDCPKSDRIIANAESFLAKYGGVVPDHPTFMNPDAMFLLAAGSPEYQGLVRRHVYNRLAEWDSSQPLDTTGRKVQGGPWGLSADVLLLSEYYLATGDPGVLPYMKYCCDGLTAIQVRALDEKGPWPEVFSGQTGGWRHNFYGGAGYNSIRAISVPATLGYHLTKEAGVQYNFQGYERAVGWFLHNGAKIGVVPYGYFAQPLTSGNNIDPEALAEGRLDPGNGCVSGAAMIFDLRGNGPVARTCSLVSMYSYNNTSSFHGGNFWANLYTPLGVRVHSKEAFQFFMKGNRWYQEIHRMHDYSREYDRGFGAGQYLAYTLPRKRLRILGAHESVFSPNPPEALAPALEAYRDRNYAACKNLVSSVIEKGEIYELDLQKAIQLKEAAVLIQKSIAHDFARLKSLVAVGKLFEASLDLPQLQAVMPRDHEELAAIAEKLNDPSLKKEFSQAKRNYDAYLKTLAPQHPQPTEEEAGATWTTLVSHKDLKSKTEDLNATPWRMKILESLSNAPDGWEGKEFDDSSWHETTMPISWHLNHTALFRAPFEISDKTKVKALRLSQYAFRQEEMQVFINGEMVAKSVHLEAEVESPYL